MTTLLSVSELHVSYGKVEAVSGVSLAMQTGQIVTVIGPNGAGKTTLLAALMGLLPSKGESWYEGQDLRLLITEERVRRGICLVPEHRELFTEMTVADVATHQRSIREEQDRGRGPAPGPRPSACGRRAS